MIIPQSPFSGPFGQPRGEPRGEPRGVRKRSQAHFWTSWTKPGGSVTGAHKTAKAHFWTFLANPEGYMTHFCAFWDNQGGSRGVQGPFLGLLDQSRGVYKGSKGPFSCLLANPRVHKSSEAYFWTIKWVCKGSEAHFLAYCANPWGVQKFLGLFGLSKRVQSSQLARDLGLKAHFEGNCIHCRGFALLEGVLMPILREFWSYEGAEIE